jgi:hypothetical protein
VLLIALEIGNDTARILYLFGYLQSGFRGTAHHSPWQKIVKVKNVIGYFTEWGICGLNNQMIGRTPTKSAKT